MSQIEVYLLSLHRFVSPCLHVVILQDLVAFVHNQAAMLKEQSTTIEKQSETIDILSASVKTLKEENSVCFHLNLFYTRKHPSRMRTAPFSGYGDGLPNLPGGRSPDPSPCEQNDRRFRKYYLAPNFIYGR